MILIFIKNSVFDTWVNFLNVNVLLFRSVF